MFAKRPLTRGINYITAHDGFTLADLVSYQAKHNHDNGEDNRDGSDDNKSWNNGAEGPSSEPGVLASRAHDVRALLATLLLSRGTPMLSMGDELGRTQHGNNNAYAQDNAGAWVDWAAADQSLINETSGLIALRRSLSPLFDGRELHGRPAAGEVAADVTWLTVDGHVMTEADWNRDNNRTLIALLFAGEAGAALIFHAAAEPVDIVLPAPRPGKRWSCVLGGVTLGERPAIDARSVAVFREVTADAGVRGSSQEQGCTPEKPLPLAPPHLEQPGQPRLGCRRGKQ